MKTPSPPCLVLVDLQLGFDDPRWGRRNNPRLECKVAALLALFRSQSFPVIHVRHHSRDPASPLRQGLPGFDFYPFAEPENGELLLTKREHCAFVGTDLEGILRQGGVERVVLAGLTADHCVNTTMRLAFDLGFLPVLVSDAVATFPRTMLNGRLMTANSVQRAAFASLHGEFGEVMSLAQLRSGMLGIVWQKKRNKVHIKRNNINSKH